MKAFFDTLRTHFGALNQSQVDGINVLLHATKGLSLQHRAYILATSWHETAQTMQPIHERGPRSYFDKYEPGTKLGKDLGNTVPGDGFKFRGRGFVQITGRANYQKASKAVGRDLVADPDKALEPETAAFIIVKGMTQGWFTGKKLGDYADYKNMRRVVNGTDKADLIAVHAVAFQNALRKLEKEEAVPTPSPIPPPPDIEPAPPVVPPKPPGSSIAAVVIAALLAIVAAAGAWVTGLMGGN